MIDMHAILVVAAVLLLSAGMVIGAAAVTLGWLLPGPGSAKVLRPKVWGYGTLIGQAGIGAFLFLGPLDESNHPGYFPFALTGMAVFGLGLYVQRLATKTSS